MTQNSDAQHVLDSEAMKGKVHLEEKDNGFVLDWAVETLTDAHVH